MFGKQRNNRFKVIYKQGGILSHKIIQDTETGINYLYVSEGYSGGLTVLVDREGRPVITSVERQI